MKIRIEAKETAHGYNYRCKELQDSDDSLVLDLAESYFIQNSSAGNKFFTITLNQSFQAIFEAGSLIFQEAAVLAFDLEQELNTRFKKFVPEMSTIDQLIISLNNRYYFQTINQVVEQEPTPEQEANNNALIEAVQNGDYEQSLALLAKGADPACHYNRPLLEACLDGQVEMVEKLLSYPEVNPNTNNGYALHMVVARHHMDILELLLKHPKLNPRINKNKALKTACAYGYLDTVSILLEDERIKARPFTEVIIDSDSLEQALIHGHIKVIQLLLSKDTSKVLPLDFIDGLKNKHRSSVEQLNAVQKILQRETDLDLLLIEASMNGQVESVAKLLSYPEASSYAYAYKGYAWKMAIAYHHMDVFKLFYEHISLESKLIRKALFTACQYGHLDMVTVLMDWRVNFSSHFWTKCLVVAADNGHLNIVDFLYLDMFKVLTKKTFVADTNSLKTKAARSVINSANMNGHLKIFSCYENKYSYDPKYLMAIACQQGFATMAELIIGYMPHSPQLQMACQKGHVDIVKFILAKSEMFSLCPAKSELRDYKYPLTFAAEKGQVEVVECLLRNKLINPAVAHNQAIVVASTNGHFELVKLLFHDLRVSSLRDNKWIFEAMGGALVQGFKEIFSFLFSQKNIRTAVEFELYAEGAQLDASKQAIKKHCDYLMTLDKILPFRFGFFADSGSNLWELNQDVINYISKSIMVLD